jgi:glycosyltransferase involved in cell wall biosynthesis
MRLSMTSSANPSISVVVPSRDRWPLLRRALASALSQTYPPTEVIVIDDGSRDAPSRNVAELRDPKVRLIRLEASRGAPFARNVGIDSSTGQYVAFLDSDDEWMPAYLESTLTYWDGPNPPLAVCSAQIVKQEWGSTYVSRPRWAPEDAFERLLGSFSTVTIAIVADRESVRRVRFDESLPASDERDLLMRLSLLGRVVCSPLPLYVKHEDGTPRVSDPGNQVIALPMLIEKYRDEFREHPSALVNMYIRLARNQSRVGDRRGMRQSIMLASQARPGDPRLRLVAGAARVGGTPGWLALQTYRWMANARKVLRTAVSKEFA